MRTDTTAASGAVITIPWRSAMAWQWCGASAILLWPAYEFLSDTTLSGRLSALQGLLLVAGSGFILASFIFGYIAIAHAINCTRVTIHEAEISISIRYLWWPGVGRLPDAIPSSFEIYERSFLGATDTICLYGIKAAIGRQRHKIIVPALTQDRGIIELYVRQLNKYLADLGKPEEEKGTF